MGLRINSHIASLLPERKLAETAKAFQRSLERLSSGQRINSARDDGAGLAIGTRLDAQVRGMRQAIRNMNEAYGYIQVADGTLAVQGDLVQRMRELAMQAANGALSDTDRGYLNTELRQLVEEFNRMTNQTTFNGTKLLDGNFGTRALQVGAQKGETIDLTLASMEASEVFTKQEIVGTGTFETRMTIETGDNPTFPVAVDLNNDGALDLITADALDNTMSICLGNGDGTFKTRITESTGDGPLLWTVADLNGDGALDLVTPDYDDATTSIILGNGNGTFKTRTTTPTGNSPMSVVVADLSNDGILDLVTNDLVSNTTSISLGNGDGTFKPRSTTPTGSWPWFFMSAVDLNNDGALDLLTADYLGATASISLGNGNGTFKARTTVRTDDDPYSVVAVDLNGDNILDLVAVDNNDVSLGILVGNGDGTFKARSTTPTGTDPEFVTVVDLNGDGALDLITNDYGGDTASISLGNGNGTFKPRTTTPTGSSPSLVLVVDLNADGALDLITDDFYDNTTSISFGNGDGTFKARTILATGTGPGLLISAVDLNSDGVLDLAVADSGDDTMSVRLQITEIETLNPTLDISTQSSAQEMLEVFDNALSYISSARASMGATLSRVDYAQSNAQNLVENLAQSQSQILDTDYAQETAEFARLQILQQAQVAVLGQANLSLQMVLQLLKGGPS